MGSRAGSWCRAQVLQPRCPVETASLAVGTAVRSTLPTTSPHPHPCPPLAWGRAASRGRRCGRTRRGCAASRWCRTQRGWRTPAGAQCLLAALRATVCSQHGLRRAASSTQVILPSCRRLEAWPARPPAHLVKLVSGAEGDGALSQPPEHAPRSHLPPALVLRGGAAGAQAGANLRHRTAGLFVWMMGWSSHGGGNREHGCRTLLQRCCIPAATHPSLCVQGTALASGTPPLPTPTHQLQQWAQLVADGPLLH